MFNGKHYREKEGGAGYDTNMGKRHALQNAGFLYLEDRLGCRKENCNGRKQMKEKDCAAMTNEGKLGMWEG